MFTPSLCLLSVYVLPPPPDWKTRFLGCHNYYHVIRATISIVVIIIIVGITIVIIITSVTISIIINSSIIIVVIS